MSNMRDIKINNSKLESRNEMILIDIDDHTLPPVGRKRDQRKKVVSHALMGIPSYKSVKKILKEIEKKHGIKLPLSLVNKSKSGTFPPIGIRKDGKIIKIISRYGRK